MNRQSSWMSHSQVRGNDWMRTNELEWTIKLSEAWQAKISIKQNQNNWILIWVTPTNLCHIGVSRNGRQSISGVGRLQRKSLHADVEMFHFVGHQNGMRVNLTQHRHNIPFLRKMGREKRETKSEYSSLEKSDNYALCTCSYHVD